jgi:NADH dehydrogenase
MPINLPETGQKRIVILGAGFGGLRAARMLVKSGYQIVLVDQYNYHQFQPLFYQVAMAGLEPSSIVFPLRKIFQRKQRFFIRNTKIEKIDLDEKRLLSDYGHINYDLLIIATGAKTNFFGNKSIEKHALQLKSVGDALLLRNSILEDYEIALTTRPYDQRQELIDIVIVGGGPTGVEMAGALAEMKKYILPRDYPELDYNEVDIHLIQGGDRLLPGMSTESSKAALLSLQSLGVKVNLGARVVDYSYGAVLDSKEVIPCKKLIWAAGVKGNIPNGIPSECITRSNRIKVDEFSKIIGLEDVYAIGDVAEMNVGHYTYGHPQVAQPALQQGKLLGSNLKRELAGKQWKPFIYKDLGSLATIGRNKAVAEVGKAKFKGFGAWIMWLVVHLYSLLGVKNKFFVFVNWVWNYLTYDQSLRLIIKATSKKLYKPDE